MTHWCSRISTLRIACFAAAALCAAPAGAQVSHNIIYHANLDEHAAYNDVWGYTAPNGDEYALLGTTGGTAVINVADPRNPYETGFFAGSVSTIGWIHGVVAGGARIASGPSEPDAVAADAARLGASVVGTAGEARSWVKSLHVV